MIVKFSGDEAETHRVEARSGTESLAGLSAAAIRVAHYVAENEVRYRQPFSDLVQFYLERTEPGSLNFLFSVVSLSARDGAAIVQDVANLMNRVLLRATGKAVASPLTLNSRTVSSGDIDALAEAVEPSLRRAHSWINSNRKEIVLDQEVSSSVVFDQRSKEYLVAEFVDSQFDEQDVSVGSLNVNGRTGRVFFHDLGRTVPFYVPRDAAARTIPTLSRYLTQYAENTGATVNIKFKRIRYSDERLKRIMIVDCYPLEDAA